jgi:hypothetical protein
MFGSDIAVLIFANFRIRLFGVWLKILENVQKFEVNVMVF